MQGYFARRQKNSPLSWAIAALVRLLSLRAWLSSLHPATFVWHPCAESRFWTLDLASLVADSYRSDFEDRMKKGCC